MALPQRESAPTIGAEQGQRQSGNSPGTAQAPRKPLCLAERVRMLPGSAIRALLASARSNTPLDLGGGIPDLTLFPQDEFARVAARIIGTDGARSLQYSPTSGYAPLRDFIAKRLQVRGCRVGIDQIIITHGSQQALATAATLLTSPTQAVALEQPAYPGALQAFSLAQAPVVALPVTEDGWQLDALTRQDVAAAYVVSNYHNPTGRKASAEQCLELARFAERTGTFVIEDDAYGELYFSGQPSRPILADAPTRGILLGSFSKTICPGLRVGWIVAPTEIVETLQRILQATSLQPGTLAQYLAFGLLEELDWEAHLTLLRRTYAARALALWTQCSALGFNAAIPLGGFFLWVETPGHASLLAKDAADVGVLAVPEAAFRHSSQPGIDRHLRLAFTRYLDEPSDRQRLAHGLLGRGRTITSD
jgi:2-aminoadipate transaminase